MDTKFILLSVLTAHLFLFACRQVAVPAKAGIEKSAFGALPDGRAVELYTLRNAWGMEVKISTYGGVVTSWTAPDKTGKYEDITLGCDSLAGYLRGTPYFGALIGRYGLGAFPDPGFPKTGSGVSDPDAGFFALGRAFARFAGAICPRHFRK